jgi:hypothetical protein
MKAVRRMDATEGESRVYSKTSDSGGGSLKSTLLRNL